MDTQDRSILSPAVKSLPQYKFWFVFQDLIQNSMSELRAWRPSLLFITYISWLNWMILKSFSNLNNSRFTTAQILGSVLFFSLRKQERALSFTPARVWCLSELPLVVNNWGRGEAEHLQTKPFITAPSTILSSLMGDPAILKSSQRGKILGLLGFSNNAQTSQTTRDGHADLTASLGCVCEKETQKSIPKIIITQSPALATQWHHWGKALLLTNPSTSVLLALFWGFRWKSRQDYADPPFVCLNHKSVSWELKPGVLHSELQLCLATVQTL